MASTNGSIGTARASDPDIKASKDASQLYTCRLCRCAIFNEHELESHKAAQQKFNKRKSKGVSSSGVCSSFFLAEPPSWMDAQAGEVEGKLLCPNKKCGARVGSIKWTGAQCSCGSWVTPAIQFPKKNLDVRLPTPAGPPPGTVVHSSVLGVGAAATRGDGIASMFRANAAASGEDSDRVCGSGAEGLLSSLSRSSPSSSSAAQRDGDRRVSPSGSSSASVGVR